MKKVYFLLVYILAATFAYAETVTDKPAAHTYYLDRLTNSKDTEYARVLALYNQYVAENPSDYLIQVERCRFIDKAYDNGEYNEKYEEADSCREKLVDDFPEAPAVLLYQADFVWGDSVIPFCKKVISKYEGTPERWPIGEIWTVYEKMARAYHDDKEYHLAIVNADKAQEHNDTLDLSLFLAEQYKELDKKDIAINMLVSRLDSTGNSWDMNQKGRMLLELGVPDKAILAFTLAKKDSNSYQDAGSLAQALIENGLYKEARVYLVKNVESYYSDKADAYRQLFDYDLQYSPADSALSTYNNLVEDKFMNDPFGVNRIRLFFNAPLLPWQAIDFLRLLLGLLTFLLVALVPVLFVLPIQAVGAYFKSRGMFLPDSGFRWNLYHLWFVFSALLIGDFGGTLLFNYGVWTDTINDFDKVSRPLANHSLFHSVFIALATLVLVRAEDIKLFWGNVWDKRKSITTGIGLAFILRFGLGIYLKIYSAASGEPLGFLSLRNDIVSVNQFFHPWVGFMLVVILAPVCEEFLFRGVFLTACQKHMNFWVANTFQSLVFAALHFDLKLTPFFFAFGFVAGYYRRKSNSLAPGMSMHFTNNLLAFLIYLK